MKKKIMILGSNGMLGSTFLKYLSKKKNYKIICISRKRDKSLNQFNQKKFKRKIEFKYFDILNKKKLIQVLKLYKPNYLLNCIGVVKKLVNKKNIRNTYFINSILPHILSSLSSKFKFKLVHFSTDCVFDGKKGNYSEKDICNAKDDYGISKFIGEIYFSNSITIRTSIIGHENGNNQRGLLEWFLNQKKIVKGYKNAIFSGFPTIEIAEIVENYIIKRKIVSEGLYNIASKPISKYDLLRKISKIYKKKVEIKPNFSVRVDRTLCGKKFCKATKYKLPNWDKLILKMFNFNKIKWI